MKETAHKLRSLTAFDISGDYLIGQFEQLASDDECTAIDAYTNIAISAHARQDTCGLSARTSYIRRLKAYRKLYKKGRYRQALCR